MFTNAALYPDKRMLSAEYTSWSLADLVGNQLIIAEVNDSGAQIYIRRRQPGVNDDDQLVR